SWIRQNSADCQAEFWRIQLQTGNDPLLFRWRAQEEGMEVAPVIPPRGIDLLRFRRRPGLAIRQHGARPKLAVGARGDDLETVRIHVLWRRPQGERVRPDPQACAVAVPQRGEVTIVAVPLPVGAEVGKRLLAVRIKIGVERGAVQLDEAIRLELIK